MIACTLDYIISTLCTTRFVLCGNLPDLGTLHLFPGQNMLNYCIWVLHPAASWEKGEQMEKEKKTLNARSAGSVYDWDMSRAALWLNFILFWRGLLRLLTSCFVLVCVSSSTLSSGAGICPEFVREGRKLLVRISQLVCKFVQAVFGYRDVAGCLSVWCIYSPTSAMASESLWILMVWPNLCMTASILARFIDACAWKFAVSILEALIYMWKSQIYFLKNSHHFIYNEL